MDFLVVMLGVVEVLLLCVGWVCACLPFFLVIVCPILILRAEGNWVKGNRLWCIGQILLLTLGTCSVVMSIGWGALELESKVEEWVDSLDDDPYDRSL